MGQAAPSHAKPDRAPHEKISKVGEKVGWNHDINPPPSLQIIMSA